MDNELALLTLAGSVIALLFVASRAKKVLGFPEGNEQMKKISASIHSGAMAYLRRQYKILAGFFAVMFVILFIMAALGLLTWFVPLRLRDGRIFFGPVRVRGHADCHKSQRPHGRSLPEQPEPGP